MFGRPQRLRRIAAQVLLMWLFALSAGIANACVLEAQSRRDAASLVHDIDHVAVAAVHGDHPSEHPSEHLQGSPGSPDPGKAPCVKFCDEPSAAAQVLKTQVDPPAGAWLAGVSPSAPAVDAPSDGAAVHVARHAPWRPSVPIPIAFLRLAL